MKLRMNTGGLQLLSVVAIVGFTFFLSEALKPDNQVDVPERQQLSRNQAPLITVGYFTSENYRPSLDVNGEVVARTKIDVSAQVSGRVDSVSNAFRPGGHFEKGDVLFTLERTDFDIRLDQAKADEAIANSNYVLQKSRAEIAARDWRAVYPDTEPPALAILEPQMISAQANLDKAIAARRAAELALERATVIAPFDGRVLSTNIGVGQLVGVNQSVGVVYSRDSVEIESPIPAETIAQISVSSRFQVKVFAAENSDTLITHGLIAGFGAQIDPRSRMGMVYIKPIDADRLTVGSFVSAVVSSNDGVEAVRLPASLVSMSTVWVVSQGTLERAALTVLGYDGQNILVTPFDQKGGVALTKPANAFEGQSVRVYDQNEVGNAY